MPNIRKRKTDRGVPLPLLQRASNEVQEGKSVRAVAKSHDICHVTLYRFHKKRLRLESQGSKSPQRVGYWTPKKVFSTEQEMLLRDYLMEAADLYYGLTLSSKECGKRMRGRNTAVPTPEAFLFCCCTGAFKHFLPQVQLV
ncbi:hypothetical protein NQZ68_010301 [Dissostichus eleginoides]|nr:hypothetical protein NQZ68_010301 [Dissostichus eleginoides]